MRANLFGLALAATLAAVGPAAGQILGEGAAIDGDTLRIAGVELRLHGVDAPETGQACPDAKGADWDCGAAARAHLAKLIDADDLRCDIVTRDARGRIMALCSAGGVDINARMVAEGLAWADTTASHHYAETEMRARDLGLGVWQGSAQTARDWREASEWRSASGEIAPEGCTIKGNVSATGERIYHAPGSRWYDRVEIDPARGQRWFCDEAEAEAAGWRSVAGSR